MTESARIVHEVAASVGLAEGDAGVRDVVRAAARLEPVGVRKISRVTELPVPIVSAICNELRKRGVVDRARPVQLTAHGRELFASPGGEIATEAACPTCAQREIVDPLIPRAAVQRLAAYACATRGAGRARSGSLRRRDEDSARARAARGRGARRPTHFPARRRRPHFARDLPRLPSSSASALLGSSWSRSIEPSPVSPACTLRRAASSCMTSGTRYPSNSGARSTPCSRIPRTRSRGRPLPLPRGRGSRRAVAGRCLLRVRRQATENCSAFSTRSLRWDRHSPARAELQRVPRRRCARGCQPPVPALNHKRGQAAVRGALRRPPVHG